ncbi:hypothetical protein BAR24_14880 [Gluconobacter oxydans]|uniref:TRAFAC clade GTPase domain-containing protein n=1 Tax=Gluconobacter thailandicus TaxID=257438 RepID=UPI0002998F31|nr:hypothetical protein [Gluconobacter thailandicus]AFW01775.1 hypothetical protein B932_2213 [Gluconobacter oxydans H24]ANQ42623.1 hypothetical protein BAR24_14880 [Gluconobacter oxydans]
MRRQLIVGMPASGKSTFIAALRHLLIADEVATALELTALSDNERHVNTLEADWLACTEVQRTKTATEGWVEFRVRDRATGCEAILSVPDLRGETFEQPLCAGRCDRELYEALDDADALLLFTNADRPDDASLISDFNDMFDDAEPQTEKKAGSKPAPFDPTAMPEEAKIVEFLQMANRRPLRPKLRKIGIVISAWDLVSTDVTPEKWFAEHRPMIDQFLSNNADLWELRLYGVSAIGGRLPRDKKKLNKMKPSKRIILVGEQTTAHDLTSPLSWLGAT